MSIMVAEASCMAQSMSPSSVSPPNAGSLSVSPSLPPACEEKFPESCPLQDSELGEIPTTPPSVSPPDLSRRFPDRYTMRDSGYATVAGSLSTPPPLVTPLPARLSSAYREELSRRDGWSRNRDRDSRGHHGSGGSYKNRRHGHRREPYRDLDDVREQRTRVDDERDEAADVDAFLENYRRTHMNKEKSERAEEAGSKGKAKLVLKRTSPCEQDSSADDVVGKILSSASATATKHTQTESAQPFLSPSALDRYRPKPKSDFTKGPTHQPLPYQLAKNPDLKRRLVPRVGAPPKPGVQHQNGQNNNSPEKRRVNVAAAARSQKAILEAVKAASGRSSAGVARPKPPAASTNTSRMANRYGTCSSLPSSPASPKKPSSVHYSAGRAISPVKQGSNAALTRHPMVSAGESDHASSPEQLPAKADMLPTETPSSVRLNDTKLLLRIPPPKVSSPPKEPSPPPIKLTLRVPPPPSPEKARKHKKHKKDKRKHHYHDDDTSHCKKPKLY